MAQIAAQPLGSSGGVNWVFLVELLICSVLGVFFLFYFNRLFATLASYAIRAWTWHKYRAHIDISALQISLLGGRLFFKSIRYHAHNETILVHDGHMTWRYWLRHVQDAEIFDEKGSFAQEKRRASSESSGAEERKNNEDGISKSRSNSIGRAEKAGKQRKSLPCRISVKVSGVEAFLYNRSPAYDNIVEATMKKSREASEISDQDGIDGKRPTPTEHRESTSNGTSQAGDGLAKAGTQTTMGSTRSAERPAIPSWLQMLPIKIECKRAAAAVGNEYTTSIVTARLESASGTVDAGPAGPLDVFKLLFNFEFSKVNVAMKPNRDFKQMQLEAARRVLRERELHLEAKTPSKIATAVTLLRKRLVIGVKWLLGLGPRTTGSIRTASIASDHKDPLESFQNERIPGQAQWLGLTRYLDDTESHEHDEWRGVEYAKASTLADCESISMRFYWDIPGIVQNLYPSDNDMQFDAEHDGDMNGTKPPDYGLDLAVRGGVIVYGPWADRQRINLQQNFFPPSYVDADPAVPLKVGEARVNTTFKLFLAIEKEVTLRVPTREESKDHLWQGRTDRTQANGEHAAKSDENNGKRNKKQRSRRHKEKRAGVAPDARPYGWLDITVKADSTVNFTMDMFARSSGYASTLDLDIKGTEITSSVNHGLLWRAGALTLQADLSQPISWDSLRHWPFNIVCDDLELFILRDHMFLVIDLVNDWASGAPPDFYTFVPFRYRLDMTFRNFVLYLNTNDANIINDPAEFDRNDFLTIEGQNLHAVLGIPLENFRPKQNEITFDVLTQGMAMRLLTSPRNTLKVMLQDKRVAELPSLTLKGSFCGNQESGRGMTDVLRMDIFGKGLSVKAYGFLIRHFINVKENYFGDYLHFKTLEEFQDSGDTLNEANKQTASLPKPKPANEMDVILCLGVEDGTILLPTNLYSATEFVRTELSTAWIDLRITSYYLDLGLNLSPLSILMGSTGINGSPGGSESGTQLYIEHVDLNGHRAFGLPSDEPVYANAWNVDVGMITGECNQSFVHDLAMAAKAIAFTVVDGENVLPVPPPAILFDATFLQLRTDVVKVWLLVGKAAILFSTDPVSVDFNDFATEVFSQRVDVLVPNLTLACVDARTATRHRFGAYRRQHVRTYAFFQTSLSVDVIGRKSHFREEAMKQQVYIQTNDQRTRRTPFLIRDGTQSGGADVEVDPPAMPFPAFPQPFVQASKRTSRPASTRSASSFVDRQTLASKTSRTSLSNTTGRRGSAMQRSNSSRSKAVSSISSGYPRSTSGSILPGDKERYAFGLPLSTMAFSSPYAEPYFPLDFVEPDESTVPLFRAERQKDSPLSSSSSSDASLEVQDVDDKSSKTVILVGCMPGIRAYVEPRLAFVVAELVRELQPKTAEDVMDDYQMHVMSTVSKTQQDRLAKNESVEVNVRLPRAAVRVALPHEDDAASNTIDVKLQSLNLTLRSKNESVAPKKLQTLAIHAVFDTADMILHQGPDDRGHILAKLLIDDFLLWTALGKSQAGHISARDVTINTLSGNAEAIMALVLRLLPTARQLETRFTELAKIAQTRVCMLVYAITQHSEHIGDPPFMSRMTYILRAFTDHYRNQESWKVVMRFRHTLQCLPKAVLQDMDDKFKSDSFDCPADVTNKVLETWSQWRNWDVPSLGRTIAFQALFDEKDRDGVFKATPKPINMTLDMETLKLQIDEGKTESFVAFDTISLGLDVTPPSLPTGLMLAEENKRTKTLLQLHTMSSAFSFNWKLIDALESLIPGIHRVIPRNAADTGGKTRSTAQLFDDELNRHDFHVVFSTDLGSLALQTLNLQHQSELRSLRMSLIGTTQASDQYGQCVSALLNADTAVTELFGQSGRIWHTILTSPSIYVDHLHPRPGVEIPPTVQFAASYGELQIQVQEQLPGMLHIVDNIITGEAARIAHIVAAIEKSPSTSEVQQAESTSPPSSQEEPKVKFHAALLAGKVFIDLSLLQALNYRIQGTAASVRIAPSLSRDHDMTVDFDVGRQSHLFVNRSGGIDHQQGILDVPPINGRVSLQTGSDRTQIAVSTTIERVDVDAGAIQGVASVLSKPEVQDVITTIRQAILDIQSHKQATFPDTVPSETIQPSSIFIYDAKVAVLGVRISASTPQIIGKSTAEMDLGIGPLHAKASNRAVVEKGQVTLIPEVMAKIQGIGASLAVHENGHRTPSGNINLALTVQFSMNESSDGKMSRELLVRSDDFEINAFPDTASITINVINHLQDRLKDLDLSREVEYLRRLRDHRKQKLVQGLRRQSESGGPAGAGFTAVDLLAMKVNVELRHIHATWRVSSKYAAKAHLRTEDLELTLSRVALSTRGDNEARLTMENLQLQLVPDEQGKAQRSLNSALLPEVGFSVAYWTKGIEGSLAIKASGKPLDLRLDSQFIIPVNGVQRSINDAIEKFQIGTANWSSTPTSSGMPRATVLGKNHFAALLVEADFAGAEVYLQGVTKGEGSFATMAASTQVHGVNHGRYGQFASSGDIMHTKLTAPGISVKLEYHDANHQSTVNGELRVDASKNMLLPNVVPLLLDISNGVKEIVQSQDDTATPAVKVKPDSNHAQRLIDEESMVRADPTALFGKTKVNLGLRICKQEFGLTCQPIAKVDAKAELEDFYFTVNTVDSDEHGHFFAMSAVLTKLSANVKHLYSREPTFSFDMDSVVLSLMNSKHFSGVNGISAILKIDPTKMVVNGKQLQDLLLFREIWLPPEIRNSSDATPAPQNSQSEDYLVQRYQSVAAAAAFPWNATISIAKLAVDLDLGQSIGKSSFTISKLWASSQKSSTWEQNLCVGLDTLAVTSQGRMSGFIELHRLQVRTSIKWPEDAKAVRKTPLIQASLGFQRLRAKCAFDYQAFAFGDIEGFDFLMYNVRENFGPSRDRLVAVLDCEKAYVFCTSTSPAQAFGLYQAFDRLIQEKEAAYFQSLKDIERHVRRESTVVPTRLGPQIAGSESKLKRTSKDAPITLHTDVVLTIRSICVGAFPSTFFDSQILKLEATNIQARFAVGLEKGRIHSGLGMTMGQLQAALASVKRVSVPKALGDISVDEVINSAVDSKGGIILRVPKVVASMHTWQAPSSNEVEYLFKSLFDGKIDVGWNLSRINFIKGMWVTHSRALAARLGKALPESAVKITAVPQQESEAAVDKSLTENHQQQKITAEVTLPQSRYEYTALEPPIIETPQLRDMGEATPPLEWIGLHRDRLPNVTHQIIIVSLLEVAKEVEDAYERILGSS